MSLQKDMNYQIQALPHDLAPTFLHGQDPPKVRASSEFRA